MFAFMYIQVAKPYESLQSAHTLEYMPRTWTEVDEREWRKERDAVSRTDAERLPNEEPSRSDAEGLANDEDGTHATHEGLRGGPSRGQEGASRNGTNENDDEFDDDNYRRYDPRSPLGAVVEGVSCVPHLAFATRCCTRRYVLAADPFEFDGCERQLESSLQGAALKRRRLDSKAGNCHDDDARHHREKRKR